MSSPLTELRVILRHFRRWPSTSPQRAYVMEEFRRYAGETDPSVLASVRRRSKDYAQLLSNITEYNRLRELDTGAENIVGNAELIRKSAARAGLVSPTDYKE